MRLIANPIPPTIRIKGGFSISSGSKYLLINQPSVRSVVRLSYCE